MLLGDDCGGRRHHQGLADSRLARQQEAIMKAPHKHAALIKAWADGAEIQAEFGEFGKPGPWLICPNPQWNGNVNYRIKPEPVPNVVTWHSVDPWAVHASCMYKSDINAADGQTTAILRIEINHTDSANPALVSATLEKP